MQTLTTTQTAQHQCQHQSLPRLPPRAAGGQCGFEFKHMRSTVAVPLATLPPCTYRCRQRRIGTTGAQRSHRMVSGATERSMQTASAMELRWPRGFRLHQSTADMLLRSSRACSLAGRMLLMTRQHQQMECLGSISPAYPLFHRRQRFRRRPRQHFGGMRLGMLAACRRRSQTAKAPTGPGGGASGERNIQNLCQVLRCYRGIQLILVPSPARQQPPQCHLLGLLAPPRLTIPLRPVHCSCNSCRSGSSQRRFQRLRAGPSWPTSSWIAGPSSTPST